MTTGGDSVVGSPASADQGDRKWLTARSRHVDRPVMTRPSQAGSPARKFSYSSLVPYILLGANVDTRLYKHPSTPNGVNPSYPQELSNWYQRKHLKIVLIKNSRIKLNLS